MHEKFEDSKGQSENVNQRMMDKARAKRKTTNYFLQNATHTTLRYTIATKQQRGEVAGDI